LCPKSSVSLGDKSLLLLGDALTKSEFPMGLQSNGVHSGLDRPLNLYFSLIRGDLIFLIEDFAGFKFDVFVFPFFSAEFDILTLSDFA
jgi:hypothetical protein